MSETGTVLSNKTKELVQQWVRSKKRETSAQQELNSAVVAVTNAKRQLADWLLPEDNRVGEVFNIWVGSGILQCHRTNEAISTVKWRREPDGMDRHEHGF